MARSLSPRSLVRKVVQTPSVLTTVTGLMVYGLAAITGPLLARHLGAAGRGDLAAVLVPSEMMGWIIVFGLPAAALYYSDRYSERDMHNASWLFGIVAGGILTAVAWPFIPNYVENHDPTTIPWLRIFFLVHIVFVPVNTTIQLMRLRPNLYAYNVLRSLQLVVETLLIFAFAMVDHLTLTTALWATLISYAVWYVVTIWYGRGHPTPSLNRTAFRDMVRYGSRLSIGHTANLAISRFDQLLLVGIVSSDDLGIYAIAATAAGISSAVADGMGAVLYDRIRTSVDESDAWRAVKYSMWRTAIASSAL